LLRKQQQTLGGYFFSAAPCSINLGTNSRRSRIDKLKLLLLVDKPTLRL